jgi:putative FmdB family regulatory protein
MPIFEFACMDCGKVNEILITGSEEPVKCQACGSRNVRKLLSVPSAFSGMSKSNLPGPKDTGCCGAHPNHAECTGPGSCCGKTSLEQ